MAAPSPEIMHALTTALSAAFTRGVGRVTPQFRSIATVVPSTTKSNTYGWLKNWPGITEWVADRQLAMLDQAGYVITNKKWESSIQVPYDDIDDDQIGQYAPMAEEFGRNVTMFPDTLSFALLCQGFSELCWDGQPFFDTDHETGGNSVSNVVGTPATDTGEPWFLIDDTHSLLPIIYQDRRPFNFTALDRPDDANRFLNDVCYYGTDGRSNVGFGFWQTAVGSKAALSVANYEEAVSTMMGFQRDNGQPLGMNPTLLVCGRKNRANARKLLEAINDAAGASNIYYKDVKLLISPYVA